ncbi:hypothetical protein MDA_GLEAN10022039 [Myotis davidii]|uniref:Uncharacterized protein n=1 Tax=Myotis davidii TaxID=225400 RepID=L5MA46_MYODS|nr:hypothetical protein MDA_GLEAN10022039 [Myotis davidii]
MGASMVPSPAAPQQHEVSCVRHPRPGPFAQQAGSWTGTAAWPLADSVRYPGSREKPSHVRARGRDHLRPNPAVNTEFRQRGDVCGDEVAVRLPSRPRNQHVHGRPAAAQR